MWQNIKPVSFDDYVDELYGKVGTLERDAVETRLKKEVEHYRAKEAACKARSEQHLASERVGEKGKQVALL